jgi:hypothetical protein
MFATFIGISTFVALLTGCGNSAIGKTATAPIRGCTKIEGWSTAAEGDRLLTMDKQLSNMKSPYTSGSSIKIVKPAVFAYPSLPQAFTGPGTYDFNFGPLGASFRLGTSVQAITFLFPPDFRAEIVQSRSVKVVTVTGKKYVQTEFIIGALSGHAVPSSCSSLVGWIH